MEFLVGELPVETFIISKSRPSKDFPREDTCEI